MALRIVQVATTPYADQKPGTSGLRKPVKSFIEQKNYTENFIQSILNSVDDKSLLICGGDGRYYLSDAVNLIAQISAANGVQKLVIGQNGILSTPSVSSVIRKLKASGGIILTASHNPGGIKGDFGIKYNSSNGGPAVERITNKIYEISKSITQYSICPDLKIDITKLGSTNYELENGKKFTIEVIDSIEIYLNLMKQIFDFNKIKSLLNNGKFNILIDSLCGVMGSYAKRVFVNEFGLKEDSLRNFVTLPDFGGKHPDPNLTYADELVAEMKTGKFDFGAAFDGDGDRNMILGKNGFFVTPSDSLAFIAANLNLIPYFKQKGITGFARSMPTAPSVDMVAKQMNLNCYEVPTGWKFFGNLMDKQLICLCGEESFGTGSDHIREKDGLWTVLCWLSILAEKAVNGEVSVQKLIEDHWSRFGRNYFTRYDYENCSSENCNRMMDYLNEQAAQGSLIGKTFSDTQYGGDNQEKIYKIVKMDNFQYLDPVDQSLTKNQGIRIIFDDTSRIIVRLSGTGSSGATVRLYVDSYIDDKSKLTRATDVTLRSLVKIALELTQVQKYTERDEPTVIT